MKNDKMLHIRNIKIKRGFRTPLKKIKDCLYGNVLNAIECSDWWIPFDSHEYSRIKKHLENECFHDFFSIDKNVKIEISDFFTDMLSFEEAMLNEKTDI